MLSCGGDVGAAAAGAAGGVEGVCASVVDVNIETARSVARREELTSAAKAARPYRL
jgi:hypothetical protein